MNKMKNNKKEIINKTPRRTVARKKPSGLKKMIVVVFVCFCVFGVLGVGAYLLGKFSLQDIKNISVNTFRKTLTQTIGVESQKDEQGNINVLLVGVGGGKHSGGYLADTIIVASFDPENTSLTMLSIPRDLYVREGTHTNKINSVFARGYARGGKNIASGANLLKTKVSEIVGLDIPYYAVVDFKGFENFVDALSGITVNVPETIYDTTYPVVEQEEDGFGKYGTFYLQAGEHVLDGATALKYARSRHSTSDFSRSLRQQQIIHAVKDKILEGGVSVSKIKEYYALYHDMVVTNFSLQEMLGLLKYLKKNEDTDGHKNALNINSIGLNVNCGYADFKRTNPGCFLYYPKREDFNGAAAILPIGATVSHISYYDYIKVFANLIFHDQKYLIEKAPIIVENAIDKTFAKQNKTMVSGWAGKVASKLKKFGFTVKEIKNAGLELAKTTIVLPGTGGVNYSGTIETLKHFIPVSDIVVSTDTGSTNLEILLGNDFITQVVGSGFDFNKFIEEK
ncbi:MAG: hypothetical protein CR971_02155 [candidate division SR1 bacterium]|nr:MAG: hypothetical protein CR971_02155 [candidate division SR1 bacterium]